MSQKYRLQQQSTDVVSWLELSPHIVQIHEEAKAAAQASAPQRTVSLDPFQTQTDNLQKRIDHTKLLKYQEANRIMELTKKQLDKTMQRLQKQRDTTFQDRLDELQHGLESQDGIVAQVNGTLEQAATVKHEKKAQLYSEWDQQVLQSLTQLLKRVKTLHHTVRSFIQDCLGWAMLPWFGHGKASTSCVSCTTRRI